jgi:peptidoglycan/LPS O-acetylase OafA/YrhL
MKLGILAAFLVPHRHFTGYGMANLSLSIESTERYSVDSQFRQDINLLRGIAIVSVVFYHFAAQLLPGGFAAVDVFFVISGFLMTKIIAGGLEAQTFSLLRFYTARCKRIIPALLALCLLLPLLMWFWLPALEFRRLGNYISYAILFISNIKLNKDAGGYFATSSHENWLLHTWSLSVEWQFYLALPLLLMALHLVRKRISMMLSLMLLAICSFIGCVIYASAGNLSSLFYLMPFRAWEMLCGGLVWFISQRYTFSRARARLCALVGYLIIAASVVLITPDSAWPGYLTLFPVLGTMLVIASNYQPLAESIDRHCRWIGLSSYSVYLWHWPIAVFIVYADRQHNALWITSGIALSFLLGWLSWVLIEQPANKSLSRLSAPAFWLVMLATVSGCYIFGNLVKYQTLVNSPNPLVNQIANEAENKNRAADPKTSLSYYGTGPLAAVIVGDSHAEATATALAAAAQGHGSVMGMTWSGCPNLYDAHVDKNEGCYKFNKSLASRLADIPSTTPVVIVNRLGHYAESHLVHFDDKNIVGIQYLHTYAESMISMACALNQHHKVYLVRPVPEMNVNVPRYLSHALMMGKQPQDVSIQEAEYRKKTEFIWQAQDRAVNQCGVKVIDPSRWLCTDGRCMGSKNLQPLYFDDNHLSETGNRVLVPMFKEIFR